MRLYFVIDIFYNKIILIDFTIFTKFTKLKFYFFICEFINKLFELKENNNCVILFL